MQTYEEFIKTAAHGNQNELIQSKQEQLAVGMKKVQSYSEFIKTSGQSSAGEYFARRAEEPYKEIKREYNAIKAERGYDDAESYLRWKYGPKSDWAKTPEGKRWYTSKWTEWDEDPWGHDDRAVKGLQGLEKYTPEQEKQLDKEIEEHRIRSNIEKDWYSIFPNKLVDMSEEDYEAFLDKMDAKWGPDWYARMTGNPELSLRSTPSSNSGNAPEPQMPPKAQVSIAAPVKNTASVAQPQQQPQSAPQKQQVAASPQPAPVKTNQAPQKQAPQRQQAAPAPAPNAPTKVDTKAGGNGSTTPPPATAKGLPWYKGIANWAKDNPELASGSAAALSAVPLYLLGRGFGKKRDRMLGLLTALLGGGAVYYGMKNWGTPWVAGHAQKPAVTPAPEAQKGSNGVMPTNSYGFNPH